MWECSNTDCVCVQCLWWESWLWHGCMPRLSSGLLAAITLIRTGAGDGGTRAGAECEAGPPRPCPALFSDHHHCIRAVSDPRLLLQKPWGLGWVGSIPFKYVFPSPQTWTLAPDQGSPEASGAHVDFQLVSDIDRGPSRLYWAVCVRTCSFFPSLHSDVASDTSLLCPSQPITTPSLCHPCPVVETHHRAGGAHMDSEHV